MTSYPVMVADLIGIKVCVYAICCRLEAVGEIISPENVKAIECYTLFNFEAAILAVSDKIKISHLRNA